MSEGPGRWERLLGRARSLVVANWPIKITALVLATVLWAAVAAEQPSTDFVPVTLVLEPPPGRSITSPPVEVRALYAGPARELIKLFQAPPVARKTIPDTITGSRYEMTLVPGDLRIAQDISATPQDVTPRTLNLTLDDVVRRTVRVVPRVSITPDSGYELTGGLAVTPATVTVRGPEDAVRAVQNVRTVPVRLTGVTGPVQQTVRLDTTGLGVARLSPEEVMVSADVTPVSERVLMGVPVIVRSDRGPWDADPPAVIVTVRGPSGRLARLTRDSIGVIAAVTGLNDEERVALEIIPPAGLTARLTPDSVTVRRRPGG